MTKKYLLIFISLLLAVFVYLFFALFSKPLKEIVYKPLCPDCNIILVSIDTLGANHLPCYGYSRNTAPNLCKFAKENIMFSNSFSNSSWTLPSHFSIFTSLYPKHHGIEAYEDPPLDKKINTLAQTLQGEGYETVYVGPFGDVNMPFNKGLVKGFSKVINYKQSNQWKSGYKELTRNSTMGKKTFLFLHTYSVHDPYLFEFPEAEKVKRLFTEKDYPDIPLSYEKLQVFSEDFKQYLIKTIGSKTETERSKETPKEVRLEFKNSLQKVDDLGQLSSLFKSLITNADRFSYWDDFNQSLWDKDNEKIEYKRALYDEGIYYTDRRLVELFELVKKPSFNKKTILIITSDHGEEFMEHGQVLHALDQLYNTTTSVPLVMYVPGIKAKVIEDLVQGIDIMPTILGMVGSDKPKRLEGLDLSWIIRGGWGHGLDRYIISEGSNDSVRWGNWKLYVDYTQNGNRYELYDLSKDPKELNNVFEVNRKIAKKLFDNLNRIIYKKQASDFSLIF